MNRLRRHKKEKAAKEELAQSEKAASSTTTIISSITPTKKEKEPASKKDDGLQTTSPKVSDFDLANALPAPDDFRTSLLMPKLSARFSMLKEQDDPESLLGKASDDSVLFSKRASRLNMFGHPNQLADIDEMSINSRPSAFGQAESNDGYGTDDDRSQAGGSMMSRARRAEVGNNLFGGRQKVYKVPARSRGASPNPGPEAGRSGLGRAVYEHDVTLSTFQRLRLKEKEERAAAEDSALNSPTFSNEDALSSIGSTNRTTYSSTASGPLPAFGRASTAATSVDGEPMTPQSIEGSTGKQFPFPERGAPKPARRYGQGLAQSVQNQQNLTLNRLESLSRQRPGTPEFPQMNRAFSRSATSLRDRLQRLPLVDAARPSSRPTSPPLSAASPRPQLAESESKDPVPSGYGTPGYNAPPLSPPISEVEEKPVPLAAALQPEDHGKATALGLFNKPRAPFDEQQFTRRQLQMHQGRSTPPLRRPPSPPRNAPLPAPTTLPLERVGRPRGISNASSCRSRPGSASSHYSEAPKGMNRTTFFSNSSPSDSGDDEDEEDIHPAFRSRSRSRTPSKPSTPPGEPQERHPLPEVRFSDLGDLKPIAENEIAENADSHNDAQAPQEPDSPTLGPSGLGLSGLVRTHLRQESDKSIQLPSPGLPPKLTDNRDVPEAKQDTADATPTPPPADEPSSQSTISAESTTPEELPEESQGRTSNDSSLNDESGHSSNNSHQRNASTETQREREEFANELAERRRKVQEKLQNFADIESRSNSRAPSRAASRSVSRSGSPVRCGTPDSSSQVKPGNAFALLKSRAGKHHLFQKSGNSSTQSLVNLDQNDPWREEDEKVPFPSLSTQQLNSSTPQIPGDRPSVRSRVAAFTRGNQDASRESSHSRNASPHSFTGFRARRDRSRSDASCRSKSRLRNDDLGTVDERSVASHETHHLPDSTYDPRADISVPSSTRPSVEGDERSSSRSSGRYRSGSHSGTPSYFDLPSPPQHHHPPSVPGPNPAMIGNAPRPSPIAPYSANATPPLDLTPSPSSPPAPTFAAVVPQRAPGHTGLQKRPINKLQISEPTLLSSTSNVPTIGLPPGASLSNGMETPPVPPMNPRRRRQTTTQTILGALKGEKQETQESSPSEYASSGRGTPADERSMFEDERPLSRNRLRKTSSEGGSLSIKTRQEIMSGAAPPPMPYPPPSYPPPKVPFDGGMF